MTKLEHRLCKPSNPRGLKYYEREIEKEIEIPKSEKEFED